jgi:hypothetical protein
MSRGVRRRPLPLLAVWLATFAAAVVSVALTAPQATPTAATPATAGPVERAAHPALVPAAPVSVAVAGAADAAARYVVYAASPRGDGPARVERVSRLGRGSLSGATLPAATEAVRAGDSLWVAAGTHPGEASPVGFSLYRLDPATLRPRQRLDLAASPEALAATPTALWVGGRGRLIRVDLRSGAVTAELPVDGEVTSLSTEPTGRRLYAAERGARGDLVTERDARSGTVRATSPQPPGVGHVAATGDGVWVWQERPAPAALTRLHRGDLRTLARLTAMTGPRAE